MAEGKWIEGLTANMSVATAAQRVLSARLSVVDHYLPLACDKPYDDVEHVHQLRVATRRANAALRVFAATIPPKLYKEAKQTLRALRRAAGEARDWDVFLLALPTISAFRAPRTKPALDFLIGYACGQRAAAQERLTTAATEVGPRWAELARELPERVRAATDHGSPPPATLGELATQQLAERMRTFTADVEAHPKTPPELHALRIAAKRLRYAIEIFADCFPPLLRDTIYPAVETVQELLGGIQDAVVALERLRQVRGMLQAILPAQWHRVRPGFDALSAALRARLPAGKKAFNSWRKDWLTTIRDLKLAVAAALTTA
ncbi:MAG: CHAD domain-containing protein [Gemmataceae bacterium]|nr:CHAD domain-containing protein [Gemmata sp.]MDW8197461.1 CHAD domain-containing protein [Gemmataceae bacterium]